MCTYTGPACTASTAWTVDILPIHKYFCISNYATVGGFNCVDVPVMYPVTQGANLRLVHAQCKVHLLCNCMLALTVSDKSWNPSIYRLFHALISI